MLIILYVEHETSYDAFHANADKIFWIQRKVKITGLLVVMVALITISFQSIKAAIANPVKSLRSE